MQKNICHISTCVNYQRYCRTHLQDEPKEEENRMKEFLKAKAEYLKANPVCKYEDCKLPAKDIHHKKGKIGKLLTDIRFFLGLCRKHHTHVETHPHEAKQKGYSESRLTKTTI